MPELHEGFDNVAALTARLVNLGFSRRVRTSFIDKLIVKTESAVPCTIFFHENYFRLFPNFRKCQLRFNVCCLAST